MTEQDRQLIERVHRLADNIRVEEPSIGAVIHRAKRGRATSIAVRSALAVGIALAVLLPLLLLLPLRNGRRPASPPNVTMAPQPSVTDKGAGWAFASAPGWNVSQSEVAPNPKVAGAWTANVPFDSRDLPNITGFPLDTLRRLPPNGVVATVLGDGPGRDPASPRPRTQQLSLPPQLSEATVRPPEAEEPRGDLLVYEVSGHTDYGFILVRVYLGTTDPSESQLVEAQAALDRLQHRPLAEGEPSLTTPARAQVGQPIRLGRDGSVNSIAYGEGSVWASVMDDSGLGGFIVQIDPETEEVQSRIPVPVAPTWEVGGGGLTVAAGRVWVAGRTFKGGEDGGMVVSFDPAINDVVDSFDFAGPVADVAVDASAAWALSSGGTVSRMDLSMGEVTAKIPLEGTGRRLALVNGSLFAMVETGAPNYGSALYRIDTTTSDVVGKYVLDTYGVLASAENGVWVSDGDSLRNFDALGSSLGDARVFSTGDALAAGAGHVWFFDPRKDRGVAGYNTATRQVDITAGVGGIALAVSPDAVWIVDGEFATSVALP